MSKKYSLVIFDKDGTLTTTVSGERFVQHPEDQKLRDGLYQRLEGLANDGVKIAIATNQGGVAAGHKSMGDLEKELYYLTRIMPGSVARDAAFLACPDFKGSECWQWAWVAYPTTGMMIDVSTESHSFRKPGPGMLLLAMKRHGVTDPSQCLMVGDRPEDEQAAQAAGMDFEWA